MSLNGDAFFQIGYQLTICYIIINYCIYNIIELPDIIIEMTFTKRNLEELFQELSQKIGEINRERRREGLSPFQRAKVQLLGQISLLSHERAAMILSLAQTADLDALLTMESLVKEELKKSLRKSGLIYDEDSYLIWIPPGSRFDPLFDFHNVVVESIDPESALVSKAVKAPAKNRQLIREAIVSGEFRTLVDRILNSGGKLEDFA